MITVVKVSGRELDDPAFLDGLCRSLAVLNRPVVLVHGGGKEITTAMEQFGQEVRFVEGLRVTPPESMAIMEMVVCGSINKRMVAKLVAAGRKALGISGVDLGLLRALPHRPDGVDLGRVGMVSLVDGATLRTLLAMEWLPVIAPVALGEEDNLPYNVNADHVAQAVASSLSGPNREQTEESTTELVFVSNVPGVIIEGQVRPQLTALEIEAFIDSGTITEGMIPKVRSALGSLSAGVATVRITNLEGLSHGGTTIV